MTNYSDNPGIVRCDVFREHGKWYETIAIDMSKYYGDTITPYDAVILALDEAGHYKIGQWNFIVLEPYHSQAYPVMIPHGVNKEHAIIEAHKGQEYMRKPKPTWSDPGKY